MSDETRPAPAIPPKPAGQLSWTQRIIIGCLVLPIVVLVLGIIVALVAYRVYSSSKQRSLEMEIAAVRASDAPLTSAELNDSYVAEKGWQDITAELLALVQQATNPEWKELEKKLWPPNHTPKCPAPGEPWDQLADAEAYLELNQAWLRELPRVLKPNATVRYPIDLRSALQTDLPHLTELRNAVKTLSLAVDVDLHQGRTSESVEHILQILAIGDTLRNEPCVISQLVRLAIIGVALIDLQHAMDLVPIEDANLTRLQQALRQIDIQATLRVALVGERAFYYTEMTLPPNLINDKRVHKEQPELIEQYSDSLPQRSTDAEYLLNLFRRQLAANDVSLLEALKEARVQDAEFQQLSKSPSRLLYIQTLLYYPALKTAVVAFIRTESLVHSADAAIAALRFRRQHAAWPKDLLSLTPEFLPTSPTDPHAESLLLMQDLGDTFKVYSVGENGIDDGGVWTDRERTDVGFIATWRDKP